MAKLSTERFGEAILVASISAIIGLVAVTYELATDAKTAAAHNRELLAERLREQSRRIAELERDQPRYSEDQGRNLEIRILELERYVRDRTHLHEK